MRDGEIFGYFILGVYYDVEGCVVERFEDVYVWFYVKFFWICCLDFESNGGDSDQVFDLDFECDLFFECKGDFYFVYI